jgi:hypothetical protein
VIALVILSSPIHFSVTGRILHERSEDTPTSSGPTMVTSVQFAN